MIGNDMCKLKHTVEANVNRDAEMNIGHMCSFGMQVSALVGATATAGLLDTRNPRILLGGAAAGAAMGVLAHVATYKEAEHRPNAMLCVIIQNIYNPDHFSSTS